MRAIILGLVLAAAACSGDDGDGDSIDAAPTNDAFTPLQTCTPAEAEAIFNPTCTFGQCHGGANPAADLDFEEAGSLAALVGVVSDCEGKVFVVAGDPHSSYLVEKLLPNPTCGGQMPTPGNPLTPAQVDCIRTAIESL